MHSLRLAVEICAICKPSVNSVEEKAFLGPLKCVQKNMGDNEGLASLSQSGEPLAGKDSSLDRDSKKRLFLSRLAFPLESWEKRRIAESSPLASNGGRKD